MSYDLENLEMFKDEEPELWSTLTQAWSHPTRKRTGTTVTTAPASETTKQVIDLISSSADSSATTEKAATRSSELHWPTVYHLRQKVSEQLTEAAKEHDRDFTTEEARAEGQRIIGQLVTKYVKERMDTGVETTPATAKALETAVYNATFKLGRIQPLLEDDRVENIHITGHDDVQIHYSGGIIESSEPVADSNEELVEMLQHIASSHRTQERPFGPGNSTLNMPLEGGFRLTASNWHSPVPQITIRRLGFTDVSLDQIIAWNMCTPQMAEFLRAAVLAKKSIVISGEQDAGKTTLLRALAREIPKHHVVGTIETDYELLLHEHKDIFGVVRAFESQPGTGEVVDGRRVGEITPASIIKDSWRFSIRRLIFGEVRGEEIVDMLNAAAGGASMLTTFHAPRAKAAVARMVNLGLSKGPNITSEFMKGMIGEHIDLIVQISTEDDEVEGQDTPYKHRFISEILALSEGVEAGGVTMSSVYKRDLGNRHPTPHVLEEDLAADLRHYGFDTGAFTYGTSRGES